MQGNTTDQQNIGRPQERRSFASPIPVFDASGEHVGVLSLDSPGDYLVIQPDTGGHDLYVPLSAVNRSDESGVYLSLTRADLANPEWQGPPAPR